jgi:hypothetical protein
MDPKRKTFEVVKTHLLSQGARSTHPETIACAYRGEGGLKCAIGILIPDDKYNPEWDELIIAIGTDNYRYHVEDLLNVIREAGYTRDEDFLAKLQSIHDTARYPETDIITFWTMLLNEFEQIELCAKSL